MNRSSGEGGGTGDVVRILVADDHPLTRDGIKAALAIQAGAAGYLLKDIDAQELARAVAVALKHGIVE